MGLEEKMVEAICNGIGISGYEAGIVQWVLNQIDKLNVDKVYIDKVGNLICLKKGKCSKKKIMVSAHIDEVGFQIISALSKGKYRIKPLGNIKTWNAYQQRIVSKNGMGIIEAYDVDNLKAHNYENLYVEMLEGDDLRTGDVVTFMENFHETEGYYCGKALDNRLACSLLISVINKSIVTESDVYYVFTVQEEIGMRGARVARSSIAPDFIINIDTSAECNMNSLKLSKGAGIKVSDSIGVSTGELVSWLQIIADKNNLKYQFEVSDCGTSELIITNELDFGSNEVGISIPCKNLHSANSLVDKNDYLECGKLICAAIAEL